MLKIIHTFELHKGKKHGVPSFVLDTLVRLSSKGYDVSVMCPADQVLEKNPYEFRIKGVRNSSEMFRYIQEEKPDIVHVHEWPASHLLKAFHRLERPKIIFHIYMYRFICPGTQLYWPRENKLCDEGFGMHCMANAYLKVCQASRRPINVLKNFMATRRSLKYAERVNMFISCSDYMAHKYKNQGIPENKIMVHYIYTTMEYKAEIAPIPGRIFFIGRLAQSKGVDILIESVAKLDDKLNWSLVIAGDGHYEQKLKNMVKEKGLNNRVRFVGWVNGDEKLRYLHEASVVVVPSPWPEPFGIVGIEAMACGRPVVAFDAGGIGDWLKNEKTGYLVNVGDVDGFSSKIAKLLTDTELASEFGKNSLRRVEERFRPERYIDRLLSIYEDVLK